MRGANKHPLHCLGVTRWPLLLSPSRGVDVTRSTLVVGRLGYQDTAVIISPPRPRHAHAGRRTPADHRTPTAADHRPQITDHRPPNADGDAATPPPKHPPPSFSLSLSCACAGTHNSHLRRRIAAAVNAAVAAAESPTPSRTSTMVPAKRGTTTIGDCLVRTILNTGKEGGGEVQPNLTSARRRASPREFASSTTSIQTLTTLARRKSEVSRLFW